MWTLHAITVKNEGIEWGKFRTDGVIIAGTQYMSPAAKELMTLVKDMIRDTQRLVESYDSGDEESMNAFLRTCIDERVIMIM